MHTYKPTLAIGMPAHNEERVIARALRQLFAQTANNYELAQVLVYSDGSTDSTVQIVKEDFPQVEVHDFKENEGKQRRLNQMLDTITTDIFVLVDADMKFHHNSVLDEMVSKFEGKHTGVVCAYLRAAKPKTIFGRVAYFGYKVWDRARTSLGERGIRYYSEGGLIAFSQEFSQVFRLPEDGSIGDDSYCFYFAIKNGFDVVVSKKAEVHFDIADNYADYVRQMRRFLADHQAIRDSFGWELINRYEVITPSLLIRSYLLEAVRSPFAAAAYICLQLSVKLHMPFYKGRAGWRHIRRVG